MSDSPRYLHRLDIGEEIDCLNIRLASDRIEAVAATADGGVMVAAAGPTLARIDGEGNFCWNVAPDICDLRYHESLTGLRVADDGRTVEFGILKFGFPRVRFTVDGPRLERRRLPSLRLRTPDRKGAEVVLKSGGAGMTVDGRAFPLWADDVVTCAAIGADGTLVAVGTNWHLHLFDRGGKQIWRAEMPAIVHAVNLPRRGRYAVAASGDGTVRWFALADGRELLALRVLREGPEWVAWTPAGDYAASDGMRDRLGRHVNRGDATAPAFHHAAAFRIDSFRPDRVARSLD